MSACQVGAERGRPPVDVPAGCRPARRGPGVRGVSPQGVSRGSSAALTTRASTKTHWTPPSRLPTMAVSSLMVPLGTPAPDFTLADLHGGTVRRDDFAAAPALLVVFLCNHCPYVRHLEA